MDDRNFMSRAPLSRSRPPSTLAALAVPLPGRQWRRILQVSAWCVLSAGLWSGWMSQARAAEGLGDIAATWVAASAGAQLCSLEWEEREEEMARDLAMALTREVGPVEVDTRALVRGVTRLIGAVESQAEELQSDMKDEGELDCTVVVQFVDNLRGQARTRYEAPQRVVLGPRV